MSVGDALRTAVVDFYHHSWRLLLLNATLGAAAVLIALAALWVPPALVLVVLLGPLAAAVMHCAVTLAQTEDVRLGDAVTGLRLHWKRGLQLAAVAFAVAGVGIFAAVFYASAGTWPLTVLVLDVVAVFAVLQLLVWPLAVAERERSFRTVFAEAGRSFLSRMGATFGLALALLIVNVAGVAAALIPFLTLTIAYSFLAAAHFALPPTSTREA